MGKSTTSTYARTSAAGIILFSGLGSIVSGSAPALAQRGTAAEFARANRVAEALRQVTLQGNIRNPGYYSDWQVKGDRIPLWSRQCIGRRLTPQQFEADQSAATSIVTCIVQDMMRQEIRTARNNEGMAIRRVAAWWVTGDPSQYNANGVEPYTKRVLSTYQPNGTLTAVQPPPPQPIRIAGIRPDGTIAQAQPAQPQAQPINTAARASGVKIATENLPAAQSKPGPIAQPKPAKPKPVQPKPILTGNPNTPQLIKSAGTTFYDRYMQAGYAASRQRDYVKALLFFRRAQDERPQDQYSATAITNMEAALKSASPANTANR